MSYVVAFDPSTKVIGWCAMDTDTGRVLRHGVVDIAVPKDGGWQHDRIRDAIRSVYRTCIQADALFEPNGWTMELPYAPGQRAAYNYGQVLRSLEVACRSVWPFATVYSPYPAPVWRSLVGAGGRGKDGPMRVAKAILGEAFPKPPSYDSLSQDEADAVCIARALITDHYDYQGQAA